MAASSLRQQMSLVLLFVALVPVLISALLLYQWAASFSDQQQAQVEVAEQQLRFSFASALGRIDAITDNIAES